MPKGKDKDVAQSRTYPNEVSKESLPHLRQDILDGLFKPVVALTLSDIHLSAKAPVARSAEPDWFEAQRRPFLELISLRNKLKLPEVYIPGDIFDKWNPTPEIINFALDIFEHFKPITIPGNHDTPYHNKALIRKSAYWTLVEAGVVFSTDEGIRLDNGGLDLSMSHSYIWRDGAKDMGAARPENHVSKENRKLKQHKIDIGIWGDNHNPFIHGRYSTKIINCGCFIRRKSDERHIRPMIGIIHEDGEVRPYYLDTSEDKWIEPNDDRLVYDEDDSPSEDFINSLTKLAQQGINFVSAVRRYTQTEHLPKPIKQLLLEAVEDI